MNKTIAPLRPWGRGQRLCNFFSLFHFDLDSGGWCQSSTSEIVNDVLRVQRLIITELDMELGSLVGAVRSKRVLFADGVRPAVVVIKDGKIHQILSDGALEEVGCEVSTAPSLPSLRLQALIQLSGCGCRCGTWATVC